MSDYLERALTLSSDYLRKLSSATEFFAHSRVSRHNLSYRGVSRVAPARNMRSLSASIRETVKKIRAQYEIEPLVIPERPKGLTRSVSVFLARKQQTLNVELLTTSEASDELILAVQKELWLHLVHKRLLKVQTADQYVAFMDETADYDLDEEILRRRHRFYNLADFAADAADETRDLLTKTWLQYRKKKQDQKDPAVTAQDLLARYREANQ